MRDARLKASSAAQEARQAHPREEHLLRVMVAAGTAPGEPGRSIFRAQVLGAAITAFEFGATA
jgi:hypothetical protein